MQSVEVTRLGPPIARHTRAKTIAAFSMAAVAPLVVVGLLSSGPFSSLVVPDFVATSPAARNLETVVTLLSSLSESMSAMSIGLLIATAWMSRQPLRPSMQWMSAATLAAAGLLALSSIYSGLRFRFDLASQLRVITLDFERLKDRLFWQGTALLFQVSVLCVAATAHQMCRDRRFRGEREW